MNLKNRIAHFMKAEGFYKTVCCSISAVLRLSLAGKGRANFILLRWLIGLWRLPCMRKKWSSNPDRDRRKSL